MYWKKTDRLLTHDAMLHLGLAGMLLHSCPSICLTVPCASWLFSKRKKKTQYNIKGFSNIPNLDKQKIYNFNAKSLWPVLSQNFYYKNHYTTWINDDNENNLWVSNIFRTYKYFNIFSL